MPRNNYLLSGEPSENLIQTTVIEWCRLHPLLKYIVIHIPNEGKRSPRYGRHLKAMGMIPGVFDLFIASAKEPYIGAWIELKSFHGKLTPAQKEFGTNMNQQGYFTAVCRSVDEAINTIKWYMQFKKEPHSLVLLAEVSYP